jgi:hypothetical protein
MLENITAPKSKRPYSAQEETRRDPDSGKFITADHPFDGMDRLFAGFERDVFGHFT